MIRTNINLATDPFRRDRPILVGSIVIAAILGLALFLQIGVILSHRHDSAEIRPRVDRVQAQLRTIQGEQSKLDSTLRKPENSAVLERSLFLNSLIARKAISWTRIFGDLEKVMPYNVRLVAVRLPQVDLQNQVMLDMQVGAEDFAPVYQLLKKLEASPQFGPTSVMTTTPPSQTDKLYKYRISVNYAQKL